MEGERALTVWNKKSPPVVEGWKLSTNIENRVFRSLTLAFLGAGIEPPRHFVPAGSLKPVASLLPQESSEHFSKYLDRTLIFDCRKSDSLFDLQQIIDFFNTLIFHPPQQKSYCRGFCQAVSSCLV